MSTGKPAKPTKLRDWIAWKTCNWILRHIATREYQTNVHGTIQLGMKQLATGKYVITVNPRKKKPWIRTGSE